LRAISYQNPIGVQDRECGLEEISKIDHGEIESLMKLISWSIDGSQPVLQSHGQPRQAVGFGDGDVDDFVGLDKIGVNIPFFDPFTVYSHFFYMMRIGIGDLCPSLLGGFSNSRSGIGPSSRIYCVVQDNDFFSIGVFAKLYQSFDHFGIGACGLFGCPIPADIGLNDDQVSLGDEPFDSTQRGNGFFGYANLLGCFLDANQGSGKDKEHKAKKFLAEIKLLWEKLGISSKIQEYKIGPDFRSSFVKETLELNPNFHAALYMLGIVYYHQGKLDEACEVYKKLIEAHPNYIIAYYYLGVACAAKGLTSETIEAFKKVLETSPDDAMAYYHLGIAYEKKGDLDASIAAFRRAVELDPEDIRSKENLKTLEGMREKFS